MVIDDDPDVQDALREVLEEESYSVVVAGNGSEALRKLQSGCTPDAILLDHMMPIMDGPTFAREAKKEPALKDLPIILVTADGRAEQKAVEMGLKNCLQKPLKITALLAALEGSSLSEAFRAISTESWGGGSPGP
jgi:CheY-like chemotaxis protein